MQLNRDHKSIIVSKIMADIPRTDYAKIIRDLVQAAAYRLMPDDVKAVYDNEGTRQFLAKRQCTAYGTHTGGIGNIYWAGPHEYSSLYLNRAHYHSDDDKLTKKLLEAVQVPVAEAVRRADEQGKARESMRQKLTTMLAGIRTLKQAKAMLEPELHKYLPVEPPKDDTKKAAQASTALVPYVVANLREMGWPKDEENKENK
jgi:hypothetical protein